MNLKKETENIILGFDVSNNTCSVSISSGEKILAYEEDLRPSMQAENLLPLIEKALAHANLQYSDIHYLALTRGPGSFTGIRIGMAAAEGILMASPGIKGIGISNFELVFYRLCTQVKCFDKAIILLNAYRKQLYYQEFDFDGQKGEYGLIDFDKVTDLFSHHPKELRIICGGSGGGIIYQQIKSFNNATLLPRSEHIKATLLCRYVNVKIQQAKQHEFETIEPLYIRPPDAIVPLN